MRPDYLVGAGEHVVHVEFCLVLVGRNLGILGYYCGAVERSSHSGSRRCEIPDALLVMVSSRCLDMTTLGREGLIVVLAEPTCDLTSFAIGCGQLAVLDDLAACDLHMLAMRQPWNEDGAPGEAAYDQNQDFAVEGEPGNFCPVVAKRTLVLSTPKGGHNLTQEYDHWDRSLAHHV